MSGLPTNGADPVGELKVNIDNNLEPRIGVDKRLIRQFGEIALAAIKRRRDRPFVIVEAYVKVELETAKIMNQEPNWGKMSKEMKKLWWDNL